MHAHAIITAPMTNTKNEPMANLRIQGIVTSNSRSGSLGLAIRLGAYNCQSGDIYFLFVAISGWRQLLARRFVCVTRGHTCLVEARRAASTWRLVQGPPGTSSESKGV